MKTLFVIFLFALCIRVFHLGATPYGFHADEVRVGWNSRSIIETGRDDRGNQFALYYNTFGDYRPTGIFYVTIPSLLLFGNTEFAVRFPSALIGAFTIFPIFFIARKYSKSASVAYFAAFLLAITPWHVTTSRATSEVVVSLFFVLAGLVFLEMYFEQKVKRFLYLGVAFLTTPYFFYHSARVLIPVFILIFIIQNSDRIRKLHLNKQFKRMLIASILLAAFFLVSPAGRGRLSQVALTNNSEVNSQVLGAKTLSAFMYIRQFITQYTTYLSPEFLIGDSARPLRYRIDGFGILSIPIFVFFIAGIVSILQKKSPSTPLFYLLAAPLPAALTLEDSPNLHRAFFMLPFAIIIAAIGAKSLWQKSVLAFLLILTFTIISFGNFWWQYHKNSFSVGEYRNEQAKEVALYLNEVAGAYDSVYVTNEPDSPYPWYAYFDGVDANEFNAQAIQRTQGQWKWENIVWTQNRCPAGEAFDAAKRERENVLVIDNGRCSASGFERIHLNAQVIKEFIGAKGQVVYRAWGYKQN